MTNLKIKPRIFYGWWIVAVGFLTLFITYGIGVYSRGTFYAAMFNDFGWSRGDLSMAMSLGAIVAAIFSPFVGTWIDKYGASRIVAVSAFVVGGFLILSSQIQVIWHAFVIFIGYGIARTGSMFLPFQVSIANWFNKKRGRAMGITMAGVGLGGFVFAPFSAYLITSFGWRTSWVILGFITWLVIIPVALLVLKKNPASLGLLPDGEVAISDETTSRESVPQEVKPKPAQLTFKRVLKIPIFWLLVAIWILFFWSEGAFMQHAFALFTDKGIQEITAGTLMGIVGLFSLIGKLVLGFLTEKIPVRYVMAGSIGLKAISLFILLIGPTWIVWPFVMVYGFSMGGTTGIMALLVANIFEVSSIGRILGSLTLFSSLSHTFSPPVAGYIFDATGNYDLALLLLAITAIPASLLTLFAYSRKGIEKIR